MNPRERTLAMIVLVLIVVAGLGFMTHQFLLAPLAARDASIAQLEKDIDTKQTRIAQVYAERPKLNRWRSLSLPPDTELARREYEKHLSALLRDSGFATGSFTVTPKPADTKNSPTLPAPKKEPIYSRLTFIVGGHGDLASLVDFLEQFYKTGLLQQIKSMSVKRPITAGQQYKPGDLDFNLTIEALIVGGAEPRRHLLPAVHPRLLAIDVATALRGGPGSLAEPLRRYASIAGRNVFLGPQVVERTKDNVEVTQFVHLTDITRNDAKHEAWLYDRYNNRTTRLRASAGFSSFRIRDAEGDTVVQGKVLRIDDRDVIFTADNRTYMLHVGQSLEQAMKKSLRESELRDLGLGSVLPKER